MSLLVQFIITIVAVGIILWGGDRLLALFPIPDKFKQGLRVVVIVVVALWCLSLVAELLGASMPWGPSPALHRHR